MEDLINKLKQQAGLTDEQAKKAIDTVKNFVIDKFPMLEEAINTILSQHAILRP